MSFVERNPDGTIKGVYANRQPGYADEELADDHPAVVTFRNRPSSQPRDVMGELDAIKTRLAALESRVR